ncbi:vitamin K epoxide reductase family protein [uncultured Gimesia sp.]|uniref:vitamin K epoxide reductase family protein n=1 Tax=uncultured Gimesia sp. TaxID=1678688 RepID=UPI0030DD614C
MSNEPENKSENAEVQNNHGGHDHGRMGMRGVTRPMEMHQHHSGGESEEDGHQMDDAHRRKMLTMHHEQTLWIYWTILLLGAWVMLSPLTFSYGKEVVAPSGERGVWLSDGLHTSLRVSLMTWSDLLSGALLLIFGWRTLRPNRPISLWICCFIGIWLSMAPVLFWAPSAAAYLNGTLIGALLIALTILIPGMPNMIMYMQMGPPTPPGWSYNPSSWPQRWIMIVTGFAGWLVSRYLAAFQLGYIDHAWDPFFGESTKRVLNSSMSHTWPLSDGALGSLAYTFEFLMGYMGSPTRWRTMPWMVAFFGVLVIPLWLTHIFLVISQPVVVHHWCTMCLLAAAIMLPMIPLEFDEVIAMGQHMIQAKRRGDHNGSLWRIFWMGGSADGCTADERSPQMVEFAERPWQVFKASIWGMSFPWTLLISSGLGLWLMFSPAVFGIDIKSAAADVAHLGGALILTVSVVCMGEVVRSGRFLNVLLGLIVALGPWLLSGENASYSAASSVAGVIVMILAFPRGPKRESYGMWERYVR